MAMKTMFRNYYSYRKSATLIRSASAVLLLAALAGCQEKKEPVFAVPRNKVVIKGSNTIGEELGPRLIAVYKQAHPEAVIEIESKGTGSGIMGLIKGVCNIGAASRTMVPAEQEEARAQGVELNNAVIGSYSVAVIVNAGSPITNLTHDQVRDIFTGKVQNWKEVGAADAPIHCYIRSPISGTYLGFQELAMDNGNYTTNNLTALTNYVGIVEAVANDPTGIGYATIQLAGKPGVKGVSIGDVRPTLAAVKEGKYPYARVLHLYTAKGADAPKALEFIQFVQSAQGQQVVDEMGFVPKP
jgi:phosphate transport system substrate-binding protein